MTLLVPLVNLERLTEATRYDTTNPALRGKLDALVKRAADKLGMKIGLATFVMDTTTHAIASHGTATGMIEAGVPAEWSFCSRVVLTGCDYTVTDATVDPSWEDNPAVTVIGARSYAGVPLVAPNGQVIGAHCVVDTKRREFDAAELAHLRESAKEIMRVMQDYRASKED
ncbi:MULTISPECIES: GAF domain-containing protein [Actinosynnema]|uniref:GAF domain-containing protein n=1 Tax=Actinosynnema TaxID=40566 RepID=UPI0020A295BC|nr:GAF domain-containing protein [Actinosynnema pretiosum]MCP2092208.1 GAF domain-containing protein [Actinosynnema pretiosum]